MAARTVSVQKGPRQKSGALNALEPLPRHLSAEIHEEIVRFVDNNWDVVMRG